MTGRKHNFEAGILLVMHLQRTKTTRFKFSLPGCNSVSLPYNYLAGVKFSFFNKTISPIKNRSSPFVSLEEVSQLLLLPPTPEVLHHTLY